MCDRDLNFLYFKVFFIEVFIVTHNGNQLKHTDVTNREMYLSKKTLRAKRRPDRKSYSQDKKKIRKGNNSVIR